MITVTDLQSYLNIDDATDADGTAKISFLSVCVVSAEALAENYCNRSFKYGQYTDYLDGSSEYGQYANYFDRGFEYGGGNFAGNYDTKVFLKNYPLKSVDSVQVLNVANYNNWDNLFTGSDSTANSIYIYPNINAFELINHYYIPKHRKVRVTYTSGFNTGEVYGDIKMVLLEMGSTFYFNSPLSGNARLGKGSENMNATASVATTFKDLKPEWKSILKKHRLTSN